MLTDILLSFAPLAGFLLLPLDMEWFLIERKAEVTALVKLPNFFDFEFWFYLFDYEYYKLFMFMFSLL